MKRIVAAGLSLVMLIVLASCGGGSRRGDEGATVSESEAKEAFGFAYVSVLMASLVPAFGQDIEGVSYDEETDELTLDKFNVVEVFGEDDSDAGADVSYTTVSGLAVPDGDYMRATLTLEGGPVTSIEFRLSEAQMRSSTGFTTTVEVNGSQMTLEFGPDDFQE